MKTLIVFNDYEDIYRILGWEFTGDSNKDTPLYDKLWDNGFNLDDWDIGFACKEPLGRMVKDDEDDKRQWFEWDDDVYWLGMKMENYYVRHHHCEFGGYHWYTVHH